MGLNFGPALTRHVCTNTSVFLVPDRDRPYNLTRVITLHCNAVPVIHRANNLGSAVGSDSSNVNGNFAFTGCGTRSVRGAI